MARPKKEGKKNIRKDISMDTEDINKLCDKMKVIIVLKSPLSCLFIYYACRLTDS